MTCKAGGLSLRDNVTSIVMHNQRFDLLGSLLGRERQKFQSMWQSSIMWSAKLGKAHLEMCTLLIQKASRRSLSQSKLSKLPRYGFKLLSLRCGSTCALKSSVTMYLVIVCVAKNNARQEYEVTSNQVYFPSSWAGLERSSFPILTLFLLIALIDLLASCYCERKRQQIFSDCVQELEEKERQSHCFSCDFCLGLIQVDNCSLHCQSDVESDFLAIIIGAQYEDY